MRTTLLLLALLPALALAQGRAPSSISSSTGTACGLASSGAAFAASFRATTATNLVPGYACDALLASCVKFGPGQDTGAGVNTLGEVVFGRTGQTTGVWRFWGTAYANTFQATSITATSNLSGKFILQGSAGFAVNQNGTEPWTVDDAHGSRTVCKTALTTCSSTNESTLLPICGTGGAVTKHCVCTGDGSTYAWRNLLNPSAGAGTSTTCPAT